MHNTAVPWLSGLLRPKIKIFAQTTTFLRVEVFAHSNIKNIAIFHTIELYLDKSMELFSRLVE